MKRLLPLPFLFALLIAPLGLSGSDPVYACPGWLLNEQIASSELIFIGTAEEADGADVIFSTKRYLKGSGPAVLTVEWSMNGYELNPSVPNHRARLGHEFLVFTGEATGGGYWTSNCSPTARIDGGASSLVAEVEAITGAGQSPKGPPVQDKDTPWAVVLPLAFAIPLAVLVVPAFLRKRIVGH